MSTYQGIDYGLGQSNINVKTGIRYGVISQHSVMSEAMDDVEYDYGQPSCPQCGNDKVTLPETCPDCGAMQDCINDCTYQDSLEGNGSEFVCLPCRYAFDSDEAYPDTPNGWSYDRDGYRLIDCLDTDIMVIESPYYTYGPFCSPCVPGAVSLPDDDDDDYPQDGPKAYCLGHDWFDEGKAPYTVYLVADDSIVEME